MKRSRDGKDKGSRRPGGGPAGGRRPDGGPAGGRRPGSGPAGGGPADGGMRARRIAGLFLFMIGLSLVLYPHIAQYINNLHATRMAQAFFDQGAASQGGTGNAARSGGAERNTGGTVDAYGFDEDVFGFISIPKLNLELPIYTGSTTANLSKGIAHLEGTSLPVGGKGTHSVLCGHNGSVTNEWFTHIDELTEGDLFYIRTREQLLTYKVISMKVIDPDEISDLLIVPDKDLITLLTCAQGGSKRLIVTGERVLDDSWTGGG